MQKEPIEATLGYTFTDDSWLRQALTHPSSDQKKSTNLAYERLEYLGDAVLELVVSRELLTRFPKADEGRLTQLRSAIVSRQHLAELCRGLGWGQQLIMSPQLEKSGGRATQSILANTFESVIGAVMMDSNYNAARKVSLRLLTDSLERVENVTSSVNSKGKLLELLQAINGQAPTYAVESMSGEDNGPFRATAWWNGVEMGVGEGSSKHKAEVAAAAHALDNQRWKKIDATAAAP